LWLPIDLEDKDIDSEPVSDELILQRVEQLGVTAGAQRVQAGVNIREAQEKQKTRYDLKHSAPNYVVGDKVVKYNRRRETRMGDKLAARFTGPFTIEEIIGKGTYRLSDDEGKIMKQLVNATNLKLWVHPVSTETPSPSTRTPPSSPTKTNIPQTPKSSNKRTARMPTTPNSHSKRSKPTTPPSSTPPSSTPLSPGTPRHTLTSTPSRTNWWLRNLYLTNDELGLINNQSGWLNDRIIDAVNKLANDRMGADANQTTLLGQSLVGFEPVQGESVHILHDSNHWIATAMINNQVMVADSLNRGISEYVCQQLRQLYAWMIDGRSQKLKVYIVPCPKQTNGSDCGVYATAAIFQWASGQLDLPFSWDILAMRSAWKTENVFVLPLERRNGEDANLAALLGLFDEDMDNLFLCARNISLMTSTLMS